jgi:hypothetical protein
VIVVLQIANSICVGSSMLTMVAGQKHCHASHRLLNGSDGDACVDHHVAAGRGPP